MNEMLKIVVFFGLIFDVKKKEKENVSGTEA